MIYASYVRHVFLIIVVILSCVCLCVGIWSDLCCCSAVSVSVCASSVMACNTVHIPGRQCRVSVIAGKITRRRRPLPHPGWERGYWCSGVGCASVVGSRSPMAWSQHEEAAAQPSVEVPGVLGFQSTRWEHQQLPAERERSGCASRTEPLARCPAPSAGEPADPGRSGRSGSGTGRTARTGRRPLRDHTSS